MFSRPGLCMSENQGGEHCINIAREAGASCVMRRFFVPGFQDGLGSCSRWPNFDFSKVSSYGAKGLIPDRCLSCVLLMVYEL